MPFPGAGVCKTCGEPARLKTAFYCEAHRGDARPRHKPKRDGPAERKVRENVTTGVDVSGVVNDIGGTMRRSTPARKRGAPTVDETSAFMGKVAMYGTAGVAVAITRDDPRLVTEAARDAQIAELQLDAEQARALVHPLSRILAPTGLWKRHGRKLVENSDVVECLVVAIDYGSNLRRYLAGRRAAGEAPVTTVAVPPSNGYVPADAYEDRQGVVVSREMLTGKRQQERG